MTAKKAADKSLDGRDATPEACVSLERPAAGLYVDLPFRFLAYLIQLEKLFVSIHITSKPALLVSRSFEEQA